MRIIAKLSWLCLLLVPILSAHAVVKTSSDYKTKIIKIGSELGSIDSIDFDQDNNIWVTATTGGKIIKMTRSGWILDEFGPADGVDGAIVDLVVGPDNLVYFIEFFSGKVKRINADRSVETISTTGFGALGGIAFSRDGRLFISAFNPDLVAEIDLNGVNPPRVVLNNPGFINQFWFGPDNKLYGPQTFATGNVVRIDVDSGVLEVVASGFLAPIAAKFDRYDQLHVVDEVAQTIYQVDTNTGAKTVFIDGIPRGVDTLSFALNNKLFFGSAVNGFLGKQNHRGRNKSLVRTGMVLPGGVDVTTKVNQWGRERDEVAVADFFGALLLKGNGRTLEEIAGSPAGAGVGFPVSLDIDSNGAWVVSSFFTGLAQTFDPATGATTILGQFQTPLDAIQFQGDYVVAELGLGRVVRVSDGAVLGNTPVPTALAALGGDLWVSDTVLGTVSQIVDDGVVLTTPIVVASGLMNPEGIEISADGSEMYIVEEGTQSLLKIDMATGTQSVIATGLAIGSPKPVAGLPTGLTISDVAIGKKGHLYVTGDSDRVLYKIKKKNP